jgi:hypothetical protein
MHSIQQLGDPPSAAAPAADTSGRTPRQGEPSTDSHDEPALQAVSRRLAVEFPETTPPEIGALLRRAYLRTAGARVQNFRVLLAEREVRRLLRGEPTADAERQS